MTDHRNNTIRFRRDASALGVNLPADVVDALDATPRMPDLAAAEKAAADAIARAAATPTKDADRAVAKALDDLAKAKAAAAIKNRVNATLDQARWATITRNRPAIMQAFKDAIADDLDALNRYAAIVGTRDLDGNISGVTPDVYEAIYRLRPAMARVEQAVVTLSIGRKDGHVDRRVFSLAEAARVRAMVIPDDADRDTLRRIVVGTKGIVPDATVKYSPAWAGVVAAQGVTFDLVDDATFARNVDRLVESTYKSDEEKRSDATRAAFV